MKKLLLSLILISSSTMLFAQTVKTDSSKKEFKNIIGVDITGLIRQFTFNSYPYGYYYTPPNIISYRRIIKSNAVRLGLGGSLQNDKGEANDTSSSITSRSAFSFRAGYEHYCYMGKRTMFYFGADLIVGYSINRWEQHYSNTNSFIDLTESNSYGISPVIGVTYSITPRLSVATEVAYDFLYTESKTSRVRTPDHTYDSHANNSRINTEFLGPQFINIRLKF